MGNGDFREFRPPWQPEPHELIELKFGIIDYVRHSTPQTKTGVLSFFSFFLYLPSNRYKSVQTVYKSGQDRKAARAALITALFTSVYIVRGWVRVKMSPRVLFSIFTTRAMLAQY